MKTHAELVVKSFIAAAVLFSATRPAVARTPIVLNDNGAWCWFQSERAIVDQANNTLLVASVADSDGVEGKDARGMWMLLRITWPCCDAEIYAASKVAAGG